MKFKDLIRAALLFEFQNTDQPPAKTFSTYKPLDQFIAYEMNAPETYVSRSEALSVPAVKRGRDIICSIATLPLQQIGPNNEVVTEGSTASLLNQFDPDVPNGVHLAQTVEDLIFDGKAWWRITAFGWDGYPVSVERIDPKRVSLKPPTGRTPSPLPSGIDPRGGVVWIDGKPVSLREVIRFDSPNSALSTAGARVIKRAILLDQAAKMYAENPTPGDYFQPKELAPEYDTSQKLSFISQWKTARRRGSTAWVPEELEYHTVDSPNPQQLQLVELTKQTALEIANLMGLDPEEVGVSTTSRTYSNVNDRRRDKINDTLYPYMLAITQRLSMNDVTRRGYTIKFDLSEYLRANDTERAAVYKTYLEMGAITVDEIRAKEGLPPLSIPTIGGDVVENEAISSGSQNDLTSVDTSQSAEYTEPVPASARVYTFSDDGVRTFQLDVPVEFAVDAESRTIEGIALPYKEVASKYGMKLRFKPGSLEWSDVSRVKLTKDHGEALGVATHLSDKREGLFARFKVANGVAGDELLSLAVDGVYDGLSVGVDFDMKADVTPDSKDPNLLIVNRATLREVALTALPAFDSARVTKVAMSQSNDSNEEVNMPENTESTGAATESNVTSGQFTEEQVSKLLNLIRPSEDRPVVNAARERQEFMNDTLPYRFDRRGRFVQGRYDFSTDLVSCAKSGDKDLQSEAGQRIRAMFRYEFDVQTSDVDELNPEIDRQDMFVDQRDFRYPVWSAINKGAPPNGMQPFRFPKFNTATGLVAAHVEGTEPSTGTYTTTSQLVNPSAVSGKVTITREVWDMGGNPAISTLVFNQMVKAYREDLEQSAANYLATNAADYAWIELGTNVDSDLGVAWAEAVAELQFERGYDWSVFLLEESLYKAFAGAVDESGGTGVGRPLFPQINPMNANGTASGAFVALNLGGILGVPSWALTNVGSNAGTSFLFDPSVVHGWATEPQRLEFAGSGAANIYTPVASIDLAIWGYKAIAVSDDNGVRQVSYGTPLS